MAEQIVLEGARIFFKNFKGAVSPYNRDGARTFAVALDPASTEQLIADGWNVKFPKPDPMINPEEDFRTPYLEVTVSSKHDFVARNTRMYIVDAGVRVPINNNNLTEIDELDASFIEYADVAIHPYEWVMEEGKPTERRGIKAYLSTGYFYLGDNPFEDPFAAKFGQ